MTNEKSTLTLLTCSSATVTHNGRFIQYPPDKEIQWEQGSRGKHADSALLLNLILSGLVLQIECESNGQG